MKYHSIEAWKYEDNMECMLLFASLVDELTFNYTIDSYKAPIMNCLSLLDELYETINDVESGLILDGAVTSIIEEVRIAIADDEVFCDIMSSHKVPYVKDLFSSNNKRDIKIAVDLISSIEAINIEYLNGLKDVLKKYIKNNEKENKLKIEKNTRFLITQLKNLGYSNDYIYRYNLNFFFGYNSNIVDVNQIDNYLDSYDLKPHKYETHHIGDHHLLTLQSYLKEIGFIIEASFNTSTTRINQRLSDFLKEKSSKLKGCFIKMEIEALDIYSARQISYDRISEFLGLFSFCHHKRVLELYDYCVVIDTDTGNYNLLRKPVRSIVKCNDLKPEAANEEFKRISQQIYVEAGSMKQLVKTIWLHRQSLASESEETQFLNLFTSLEVLMPKDIKAGKDRIKQISDVLIPILCLAYLRKLIASLSNDLMGWKEDLVTIIEENVEEGDDINEKVAGILCLNKYDELRENIRKKLIDDKNILAAYRIDKLHGILSDRRTIYDFIKRHENRLRQHMDRLYRTRNKIVHSGESIENLGSLLENLHFYFDVIINAFFDNNVKLSFTKFEYTFASADVRYKHYLKNLEKNKPIEGHNYIELLFSK